MTALQTPTSIAYANLVGTVPQINKVYQYKLTSPTAGTLLPMAPSSIAHFNANEYEWYVQDSWRVKPNLTLTFGIRHTILQTPWETKGQQVTPTIDTHAWYHASANPRPRPARFTKTIFNSRPPAIFTGSPVSGRSQRMISLPGSLSPTRPTPKPPSAPVRASTTITTVRASSTSSTRTARSV